MKKPHIAFVNLPQHSNVNGTLPIVSTLVRRGYRVTYVTSDVFATRIASLGAEVVACPRWPMEASSSVAPEDQSLGMLPDVCRFAAWTLPQITVFYTQDRPDLLLYDSVAFAGRILASKLQIPAVHTSPFFAYSGKFVDEHMRGYEFGSIVVEASKLYDQFLDRYDIVGNTLSHREDLNIYLYPRIFQPGEDDLGRGCLFAGRCAGEQPHYGTWRPPNDGDREIVLVSTSTAYVRGAAHFQMFVDALSGLGWHVVLSIGDKGVPSSLGTLPPNFEVVQNTAHVKILPHARLHMCLGGTITASEAAYHGVPLVVTSCGYPELEWQADNLVRVGLAKHLMGVETNVESVRRTAIQFLEDDHAAHRANRVQHVVQRSPGAEEVANRIQEYWESDLR